MPLVSITRLRIRSWRYVPAFLVYALRAAWQAKTAPGNLAVTLLTDQARVFWTRTIWNDEAAMRSFMASGAHRNVMPHLLEWCDEASVVHWTQDSREPPSWAEALRRTLRDGRRSKVNHPSDGHRRFEFPEPTGGTELRFK
jgi:Domain of unknown function (DUF3291)